MNSLSCVLNAHQLFAHYYGVVDLDTTRHGRGQTVDTHAIARPQSTLDKTPHIIQAKR